MAKPQAVVTTARWWIRYFHLVSGTDLKVENELKQMNILLMPNAKYKQIWLFNLIKLNQQSDHKLYEYR